MAKIQHNQRAENTGFFFYLKRNGRIKIMYTLVYIDDRDSVDFNLH